VRDDFSNQIFTTTGTSTNVRKLKYQEIASQVDQVLLEKLEVRRFEDGKTKNVRGKKVPAGDSTAPRRRRRRRRTWLTSSAMRRWCF
jgi:hypothetical protein